MISHIKNALLRRSILVLVLVPVVVTEVAYAFIRAAFDAARDISSAVRECWRGR